MTVVSARLESNVVENDSPSSHFVRLASRRQPHLQYRCLLSLWIWPNFPLVNDGRMDEPPHTRVLLTKVRCQKKHKAMLFPMVLMAPVKHSQRATEQDSTSTTASCSLGGGFFSVPSKSSLGQSVTTLSQWIISVFFNQSHPPSQRSGLNAFSGDFFGVSTAEQ